MSVGFAYTRLLQAFGSGADIATFPRPERSSGLVCKQSADCDCGTRILRVIYGRTPVPLVGINELKDRQ